MMPDCVTPGHTWVWSGETGRKYCYFCGVYANDGDDNPDPRVVECYKSTGQAVNPPAINPQNASSGGINVTTKGDLQGFGSSASRIPVGADTQVLTADSTQTLGLKWATPSGGGGSTLTNVTFPLLPIGYTTGSANFTGTAGARALNSFAFTTQAPLALHGLSFNVTTIAPSTSNEDSLNSSMQIRREGEMTEVEILQRISNQILWFAVWTGIQLGAITIFLMLLLRRK